MTPRLYSSFAGADRAKRAVGGRAVILRVLDDPRNFGCFLVLPTAATKIMALDERGVADGTISFFDISTQGSAS